MIIDEFTCYQLQEREKIILCHWVALGEPGSNIEIFDGYGRKRMILYATGASKVFDAEELAFEETYFIKFYNAHTILELSGMPN